jgi:hypothetical protein
MSGSSKSEPRHGQSPPVGDHRALIIEVFEQYDRNWPAFRAAIKRVMPEVYACVAAARSDPK